MVSIQKSVRAIMGGAALLMLGILPAAAASPLGVWKQIDDETGNERSHVEIYEEGGKFFGKIIKLIDPPEENPVCVECEGELKNAPVLGLRFMWDFEADGDEWTGGTILDPESGDTYNSKFWLEDANTLKLRGYILFLYRTQTWFRVD